MQKYSEAFLQSSGGCFFGHGDAAVGLLVTHFQELVPAIVAGTWKHSMIGLSSPESEKLTEIKQRKQKRTTGTDADAKETRKRSSYSQISRDTI